MKFQIIENYRNLSVRGPLDGKTADILRSYVNRISEPMTKMVLDLSQVSRIEPSVSYVLLKMFVHAIHDDKRIMIKCKENISLCQVLKETKTFDIFNQAAILK